MPQRRVLEGYPICCIVSIFFFHPVLETHGALNARLQVALDVRPIPVRHVLADLNLAITESENKNDCRSLFAQATHAARTIIKEAEFATLTITKVTPSTRHQAID